MDLGLIRRVDIDSEMQQSYLDYAMSVIVSRALPDARDGLKPVQRRILYAMYDMGLRPDSAYKKSARIVGEVLGKYHPHGDMAVYEAMARLAQDFSMRYPLVDGQGNFGSVDGDPPAAMRYTEARLSAAAVDILAQIEKDTVDYVGNFDDTLTQPDVLPAAIPNLLVNGATGIAVGMATNIPPHNLGEVVDALVYLLDHWDGLDDIPVDDLMRFIQGPDFPTGGIIIQDPQGDGLTSAYGSGRGRVVVQARAHLEEMGRGRSRIIVTELPYMTNKSNLIERIAELVREGRLEGVTDLRDESDRQGMRIVIEIGKNGEPEKVLRELYHRTPMQSTFGITLLALVDGEPRLLSLKQALRVYLEHRLVVIRRRSEYDLGKARQRAHILEGLRIALANLDEIIALIRKAADADQARQRLIARFKLSEIQANAILDMPLRRLAALERKKIDQEYKELGNQIAELTALLASPKKMRGVVSAELGQVRARYADRRRTQIVQLKEGATLASLLTTTDVTPAQTVWVAVSADGRIGRAPAGQTYPVEGADAPRKVLSATTHDTLYLVGAGGRASAIAVHALPEMTVLAEGPSVHRVAPALDGEPLAAWFTLPPRNGTPPDGFVLTVSAAGMVKKSALADLPGPSSQPFVLARVNEGDRLAFALPTTGSDEVMLLTALGMAIRFSEAEVRPMGLVAAGVGGIRLAAGDRVIAALLPRAGAQVLLVTGDGRAKRVPVSDFPGQSRYGQGVIAWKLARGGLVAGAVQGAPGQPVLVLQTETGQVVDFGQAAAASRAGQGKPLLAWLTGEAVTGLEKLPGAQGGASGGSPPPAAPGGDGAAPKAKPATRPRSTAVAPPAGGASQASAAASPRAAAQTPARGKPAPAAPAPKRPARGAPAPSTPAPARPAMNTPAQSTPAPARKAAKAMEASQPSLLPETEPTAPARKRPVKAAAAEVAPPPKPAARARQASAPAAEPATPPAKPSAARKGQAAAQPEAPAPAARPEAAPVKTGRKAGAAAAETGPAAPARGRKATPAPETPPAKPAAGRRASPAAENETKPAPASKPAAGKAKPNPATKPAETAAKPKTRRGKGSSSG